MPTRPVFSGRSSQQILDDLLVSVSEELGVLVTDVPEALRALDLRIEELRARLRVCAPMWVSQLNHRIRMLQLDREAVYSWTFYPDPS